MKKNKMMRVASALLVAVLLTTSVISGTYAKYVTTVEGNDSARVAQWGIGKDFTDISTFSSSYDSDAVKAANGTDLVVAPGTTDTGIYKLNGKPETDYQITFDFNAVEDVFLKEGTYKYGADYADTMDVVLVEKYFPIKWTVNLATTNGAISGTGLVSGDNTYDTLTDVATAIDATKIDFDANETCDVILTVTWNWAFEGQNDQADTILGNLAVGSPKLEVPATLTDGTDYNLNVAYTVALTATQIDG